MEKNMRPIGIFDSGIGGLTVLNAILNFFPNESYVYIGDTARLPYGTKSPQTIIRYSEKMAEALLKFDPKAMIIACNTASTHALPAVQNIMGDSIPTIGMIDPAAKAAIAATRNKHIAVIGTIATISSDIYANKIKFIAPDIAVTSIPCQMMIALAEEGWVNTHIARDIILKYIDDVFDKSNAPDTLILGCTHFPLFAELITDILGNRVTLINTGFEAGKELARILPSITTSTAPHIECFVTDGAERFEMNMKRFINETISNHPSVKLLDII
jgi:glutamate racemase